MSAPVYAAPDVAATLELIYLDEHLAAFGPPPDPAEGFITFFDPGCSVLALRAGVRGRRVFYPQTWYDREQFATLKEAPRYRQVRMEPLPGSFRKTYQEKDELLPANEEVPTARAVAVAVAIHFLATGERLLQGTFVWCADTVSNGIRVFVGGFVSDGFGVYCHMDTNRGAYLGLASSRKL
jgi:hypothetical protein